MRDVLFLAHRLPWPPDRGDKIRSWNLLRHLMGLTRVHLFAFADDAVDMASAEALRGQVASLHVEIRKHSRALGLLSALATGRPASVVLFDSQTMREAVEQKLAEGNIGTIFAFSGQMAQFVPEDCDARFLMDFVDVDSEKFSAYARRGPLPLRLLYRREARLLSRFEQAVARRAWRSLFVSEHEAALFRTTSGLGADRVIAIENGIDLDYLQPRAREAAERLIVFTGQMDYPPNVEAVVNFATDVFPHVLQACPDARFAIVGRNPTAAVQALAQQPGVEVTGAVPDVRPWLANAALVVAPLEIARGVQNKVLEAMAMARAVVASPAAAEGIDAEHERDLIVADADAMAPAIAGLLHDPAAADRIGQAARARMEARYRWDERLRPLEGLLA